MTRSQSDIIDQAMREKSAIDAMAPGAPRPNLLETERAWLTENHEAIQSSTHYIAEHGLPLKTFYRFK